MSWKPQAESDVAIYRQIYHYFEQRILSGDLPPGTRMPAERLLAEQYTINRSTVSTAYDELRATGLICSKQGSGTIVSESMWETVPASRTPNWQRCTLRRTFDPTHVSQRRILEASKLSGIINLTQGELSPDLMPLQELRELAAQVDYSKPFTYLTDLRGDSDLRQTLSAFLLEQLSIQADPNELMITSGVAHSLHLISNYLLQPGDAIAVEGPSYLYAMRIFADAGLRMYQLPVDQEGLIPEKLIPLINKHRIRMVFTNPTFQNPTGTTLSLKRRQALLAICEQYRIPIVEDDPYGLLQLESSEPPIVPIRALPGGDRFVIYLGTMSKIASPGMRIGWLLAPEPVIHKLTQAKRLTGYSSSHAGERIAAQLLSKLDWRERLLNVNKALLDRRNHMHGALKQYTRDHAALMINPRAPIGGFYLWLKLAKPVTDKELIDAVIGAGVLVYPGSIFGADRGFIRLTYASVSNENIAEGIARLGQALDL